MPTGAVSTQTSSSRASAPVCTGVEATAIRPVPPTGAAGPADRPSRRRSGSRRARRPSTGADGQTQGGAVGPPAGQDGCGPGQDPQVHAFATGQRRQAARGRRSGCRPRSASGHQNGPAVSGQPGRVPAAAAKARPSSPAAASTRPSAADHGEGPARRGGPGAFDGDPRLARRGRRARRERAASTGPIRVSISRRQQARLAVHGRQPAGRRLRGPAAPFRGRTAAHRPPPPASRSAWRSRNQGGGALRRSAVRRPSLVMRRSSPRKALSPRIRRRTANLGCVADSCRGLVGNHQPLSRQAGLCGPRFPRRGGRGFGRRGQHVGDRLQHGPGLAGQGLQFGRRIVRRFVDRRRPAARPGPSGAARRRSAGPGIRSGPGRGRIRRRARASRPSRPCR